MKLDDYIYLMSFIISFISIFSIILAFINNDKKTNKLIFAFSLISIVYMFIVSVLIHNLIGVNVKLDIILVWFIEFFAGIGYLISCVICSIKEKKIKDNPKYNFIRVIIYILLIAPIALFIFSYNYEYKAVDNGKIIVVLDSNGNGGIGSSEDFVYVINDNDYKEISLEVNYRGIAEKYNYKKLENEKNGNTDNREKYSSNNYKKDIVINDDYEITLLNDDYENYLILYKNKKIIHKIKIDKKYFNIEIDDIYYK